jgi:hypothetical protein
MGINGGSERTDGEANDWDEATGEFLKGWRRVLPMCGDATRGNCLGQIHVTDDPEKERDIPERPRGDEPPVEEYTDDEGKTYYPPLEDDEEKDDRRKRETGDKDKGEKKALRELNP